MLPNFFGSKRYSKSDRALILYHLVCHCLQGV
jgi:hypothetical protein